MISVCKCLLIEQTFTKWTSSLSSILGSHRFNYLLDDPMHLLVDFASTQTSSISECEHSPTPTNSSREMRGFTVTSREETKFKQGIIQLVIYTHGDQFFSTLLNTNLIENATRRKKQSQTNKYRSGIKMITTKKKRAKNRENLQGIDEALLRSMEASS